MGLYKVNFDGAIDNKNHKSGCGIIIRDCNGEVIASLAKPIYLSLSPEFIEAHAALAGMQFAKDIGISAIILEEDCKSVIDNFKSPREDLSPIGCLTEDTKSLKVYFSK